jgi:pimeloyl-ACP methyl ester carboxylesterase
MTTQTTPTVHDHVDAAGLRTYYEVQGTGRPVVLLHGGLCTVETWGDLTPTLATRYRVYAPERRGHGRTPDVPGPITYAAMADDTIAFLDAVGVSGAHLVGWSDGAIVGLLVAQRRPDLAGKLVLIGQPVNPDGYVPWQATMFEAMTPELMPPMFEQMYAAVSPDGPDHYRVVFDKLTHMWRTEPRIAVADLTTLAAPTLVLLGDDDGITVEHADAIRNAIPDAQLAIVPGASHALPMEKPDLTGRLILDFLADEQVPKLLGSAELAEMLAGPTA